MGTGAIDWILDSLLPLVKPRDWRFGFAGRPAGVNQVPYQLNQPSKVLSGMADTASAAQLGFGLITPVLLVLYLVAMRTVCGYERDHAALATVELDAALQPCAQR